MSCIGFWGVIFSNHLCIVLVDSTFLRLRKSQLKISEIHRHSNQIWSRLLLYLCWICVTQANACTLVRRGRQRWRMNRFQSSVFIQERRDFDKLWTFLKCFSETFEPYTHERTHARTHARTHSLTHSRTHARTHARTCNGCSYASKGCV